MPTVIASIEEQGKLTAALRAEIEGADTKQRLEDLYLPYKPKRRTKAQIAREAGLEPLADGLLADPTQDPNGLAAAYVDAGKGVADAAAALEGARQILMERFAEDPELTGRLRDRLWEEGVLVSKVVAGKEQEGNKFSDYFDYREAIAKVPSHRALALFRGRNQGVLNLDLVPGEGEDPDAPFRAQIAARFGVKSQGRAADDWLIETVRKTWRIKLLTRLDLDLKGRVLESAEEEAIRVFGLNLKALLLAAPAGRLPTLGLDPGLRTGVKVAVVDATGRVAATDTIYPHVPRNQWDAAIAQLAKLCQAHQVKLISIGNGTASRETDKLARELIKLHPELGMRSLVVSEAGASVYSASEFASKELPGMDVSLRGAVSIARRLQDPLAELVKIEPKAIGVGQYQHDVNQPRLARALESVVEDCVNAVGVDLNTASVPLLAQVSGLNKGLAEHIVAYREANGAFPNRKKLMAVPRFGDKAFQQSAGFLRVPDSDEPLDASAVHPEAYPVVRRICERAGKGIRELIGDTATLRRLDAKEFTDDRFGLPTVQDILSELQKPGRDPRPEFKAAVFREGVETLKDLQPDMILEGHRDQRHQLRRLRRHRRPPGRSGAYLHAADQFVKDPHQVVKSGDLVKVKVMEVDLARKRIALSMRLGEPGERRGGETGRDRPAPPAHGGPRAQPSRPPDQTRRPGGDRRPAPQRQPAEQPAPAGGALAAAFEKARKG